ncbi:MAG: class I SAM-dependent methyltransferase, partial [Candidatus Omnitrophica bacterium]|nr:class I SAM-dependent methyltransferase [Candidatus Omnitrophota bacterium]
DIVISSEVIEHIEKPETLIKGIFRVLKNGGLAIITTPQLGGGLLTRFIRLLNIFCFGLLKRCVYRCGESISFQKRSLSRLSSAEGKTGVGFGHISVKSRLDWQRLFKKYGFKIEAVEGTSGLLLGGPLLDAHRIIFGLTVVMDALLEYFPFSYLWSEGLFFELKKP